MDAKKQHTQMRRMNNKINELEALVRYLRGTRHEDKDVSEYYDE